MKERLIFAILAILLIFVSGCKKSEIAEEDALIQECINACKNALENGVDLSTGPCLLDPMSNPEWVCDVAHKPRQAIDNKRENQCNAWHNGSAKHFIEVTPNCELIRVY